MTDTTRACPEGSEEGFSSGGRSEEKTLSDQVRGILTEALNSPGLPERSKARLRDLMAQHHERPGLAFLEHLRVIRGARVPEEAARRLFPADPGQRPGVLALRLSEPAPAS